MTTPTIRGHQAYFQILENDQPVIIDSVTRVSLSQDSSFTRHNYVGAKYPEGDQTMMGWSGSIQLEVRDSTVEDFIDRLVANNVDGINVAPYAFVIIEEYSDGSVRSYGYNDCQFKYSRDAGGMDSKVTKTLDFQAAYRNPID